MTPGQFSRTISEKRELDWIPKELRRIRWLAVPAGALPVGAAVGGAFIGLPVEAALAMILSVGAYMALGGVGIAYLADRQVLRRILQRRVQKLAGGELDLLALRGSKDGELVHVRGRVEADETIPSVLEAEAIGVYRRVRQNVDGLCVLHEDARDFWLVDGSGERIRVEVAESRLVTAGAALAWREVDRATFLSLLDRIPEDVVPTGRVLASSRSRMIHIGEVLVPVGATVDVIGFKSRIPDFSIQERLARETPMRTILRGGGALPLLVSMR